MNIRPLLLLLCCCIGYRTLSAQSTTLHSELLHTAKPDYPVPYEPNTPEKVQQTLTRILNYLEAVTPTRIIDRISKQEVPLPSQPDTSITVERGDFSLTSYEWGVTYAGMLLAAQATGDARFSAYTVKRLEFLARHAPYFRQVLDTWPKHQNPALRQVIAPHALDDCGAMCAAMIKTQRAGLNQQDLRPAINRYIQYISTQEYRLNDGTLARNRPLPNTLWLDDLFMSVPALAQMGKLTGDKKYFDDACKQVIQFSRRMFNQDKGMFMHGWVAGMAVHPEFYWARANGWAFMTMVELLDVLPETHPQRSAILTLFRAQARGLAARQAGSGFWHQLLDREDSYLETSATAIYAYALARAVNRGWIDASAYAPAAMLAWNAVASKVTEKGQVAGVCVGTGMAFDPAFYYHRPTNVYAAHGYGPTLLAGAEIIELMRKGQFSLNDSALMYVRN